ncbi:MAG: helix-turn-helix transcriptional regulator [Oscillospiraceae bacterium]|nr:helix-turn-helix transcriptional regulator [Oscillospiraceae bacterium]
MNDILFVGEHLRTYEVQWHQHDYWELVYCTVGQGCFQFENGASIQYKEGDAVAIPPHERHTNISAQGFCNLHLTMEDPVFPFRGAFRVSDEEGNLKHAINQAKYYFLSDINKRELVLNALGELIASYMIVYRSKNEFSAPVERIRTLILRNYAQADFALDDAVREMPFHYDYLRKLFKKEMGITPLEYMTNLRMKKAENLLSAMWSREYSVSEVAQMCGYEDALYFSRVFKKNYGCSPSNFTKHYTPHPK